MTPSISEVEFMLNLLGFTLDFLAGWFLTEECSMNMDLIPAFLEFSKESSIHWLWKIKFFSNLLINKNKKSKEIFVSQLFKENDRKFILTLLFTLISQKVMFNPMSFASANQVTYIMKNFISNVLASKSCTLCLSWHPMKNFQPTYFHKLYSLFVSG